MMSVTILVLRFVAFLWSIRSAWRFLTRNRAYKGYLLFFLLVIDVKLTSGFGVMWSYELELARTCCEYFCYQDH